MHRMSSLAVCLPLSFCIKFFFNLFYPFIALHLAFISSICIKSKSYVLQSCIIITCRS
jgi:hypothetical protein